MFEAFDAFKYLAEKVGCPYISDLRTPRYNLLAKIELEKPNFPALSDNQKEKLTFYLSVTL